MQVRQSSCLVRKLATFMELGERDWDIVTHCASRKYSGLASWLTRSLEAGRPTLAILESGSGEKQVPHKLRRVFAVNIVAATTGQPSCLIAQLDVRGSTLAVGVNGVGKTTFLRTIPLFYGATPKQILRGSHRGSMIAYALPADSSAIVYEYERTSEDDLRCAVMYRRPGEDEAVFYIMRSGYEERFFVDENEEFVTAQEFKARAEAAGIWVSPALHMHEYRSVILREKPMTKNAQKLRELALEHSLGPHPLYNLGSIAAAMTTEKINFDDLKRIVVDRVTEDLGNRSGDGVLSQKQSKEEVQNWITTRQHMGALLARAPDAKKLMGKVEDLRQCHKTLCALHVAVKEAVRQRQQQQEAKKQELEDYKLSSEEAHRKLKSTIQAEGEELEGKVATRDELAGRVRKIDAQKKHFADLDIESSVELQQQEPTIKVRIAGLRNEHGTLTATAGNAQARADARTREIESAAKEAGQTIVGRRETLREADRSETEKLRLEEAVALGDITEPPRLKEIQATLRQLERQQGALQAEKAKPSATLKTIADIEAAEGDVARLEKELSASQSKENDAKTGLERCEKAANVAADAEEEISKLINSAHENLKRLNERLAPAPGTLLAFLREQELGGWCDVAKAINPELLKRNDLEPELLSSHTHAERMEMGGISLDVSRVDLPEWVSMQDVKRDIAQQEGSLKAMRAKLQDARAQARAEVKDRDAAKAALQAATAQLGLVSGQLKEARQRLGALREQARLERQQSQQDVEQALEELKGKIEELAQEDEGLRLRLGQRRKELTKGFEDRRKAMGDALKEQLKALKEEEDALEERKKKDLEQVKVDLARELEGKGIDMGQIEAMEKEIEKLQGQLNAISCNRGEVRAWLEFKDEILPTLEPARLQHADLVTETNRLSERLTRLGRQLTKMEAEISAHIGALNGEIQAVENAVHRLGVMRDQHLKDFLDFVPAPEVQMNPDMLENQATQALQQLRLLENEVQAARVSLRGEINHHEGEAADWLRLKEKELPDRQTVLSHQYEWIWAEMVCQWFDPQEHGQLLAQLNREKQAIFMKAGGFLDALQSFDRNIDSFNKRLRKALSEFTPFQAFGELSVDVRSGVGNIAYLNILQRIQERHRAISGTIVSIVADDRELPSDEDTNLMREYRNVLVGDGGFNVNLRDQVQLECSLRENNKRHKVTNQEEFAAISSNGLTALITAMFLMGFVQMIRGADSPVRLTWITDEIGRFDSGNVANFLKTLSDSGINVISAAPSADPLIAKHFDRLSSFEGDGAILTAQAEGEPA